MSVEGDNFMALLHHELGQGRAKASVADYANRRRHAPLKLLADGVVGAIAEADGFSSGGPVLVL